MAKDTFYFSHDYNARLDSRIKKLMQKHGLLGYGIFWALVEDLYNNANALPLDYECIAFDLRCEESVLRSVMNDFDLFVIDDISFGSMSVQRRLDERDSKSVKARESARKRWDKCERIANALPLDEERNAIKERKGKEKEEIKARFDLFWSKYPVKVGKKDALKAFENLPIKEQKAMMEYLPKQLDYRPFPGYNQPHPATFIRSDRWNDKSPEPTKGEFFYDGDGKKMFKSPEGQVTAV